MRSEVLTYAEGKLNMSKVLVYDIETAGVGTLYADQGFIIVIGYKWLGEKEIHALRVTKKELHHFDDSRILRQFSKVIEKADLIVAHYGDEFDERFIRGRLVIHNLPPIPKVKSRDTWAMAKRIGKFSRNGLGHLARVYRLGEQKGNSGFPDRWLRILQGDMKELSVCVEYCKQDVLTTEALYLRLRSHDWAHPSVDASGTCPVCGSNKVHWRGYYLTKANKWPRFQCQRCGAWGRATHPIKRTA